MKNEERAKLIQKFGKANLGTPILLKRGKKVVKEEFKVESVSAFNMARRI